VISVLSENTKAILLLTAPLIAGRGSASPELLSPGEYSRLARHLREIQRQPADLLTPDASELVRACETVVESERLGQLLARGFLLSQAIERWHSRAIWVVSRADSDYPRRVKARLKEDSPAILYGCGEIGLLESGGLAVVGSRHIDETLIEYTRAIGHLSAEAGITVVSGGAKGIDQAAMRGALEAGGKVIGVLGDSLEKTAMNREHRDLLIEGQLVLVSPYDPSAGFNVGHAMQRNKVIYALADASLVVSSDVNKGGTWAGATEQLDKLRLVPVYVRSTGEASAGLEALCRKGALPWPNPKDTEALTAVFDVSPPRSKELSVQGEPSLFSQEPVAPRLAVHENLHSVGVQPDTPSAATGNAKPDARTPDSTELGHADVLFGAVRDVLRSLLTTPMKDADVAAALQVSTSQAKAWLQRLADEGTIVKRKKPAGYVVKQASLFE